MGGAEGDPRAPSAPPQVDRCWFFSSLGQGKEGRAARPPQPLDHPTTWAVGKKPPGSGPPQLPEPRGTWEHPPKPAGSLSRRISTAL